MWRVGFYVLAITLLCITGQSSRKCTTSNGELAQCISIYSCARFMAILNTAPASVKRFLRSSFCGADSEGRPMVCCGSDIDYKVNRVLPDRNNCGHQDSFKIIGGTDADINEFPWTTMLAHMDKETGRPQFHCGGSLISEEYVLTAGHCVIPQGVTFVRLGEWSLETTRDCKEVDGVPSCADPVQDVSVKEIVVHEEFSTSTGSINDIALIRLAASVTINDFVKPICLPMPTERSNVGEQVDVAGWGNIYSNGTTASIKQKLKVPITNLADCKRLYRRLRLNVTDSELCAGGEADKDTCKGDSGGPLIAQVKDGVAQYYLEGITSKGFMCGLAGWPAIYTRVSAYLDWINQNVKP